jgi:hypothetical protein
MLPLIGVCHCIQRGVIAYSYCNYFERPFLER